MSRPILKSLGVAAAALACALPALVQAQAFPSKPLRIIVPFPPGGAADITSRVLGDALAKSVGQTVVIENRPGGSTIIGSEVVARAPADGYTMLVVFPSFIINPSLRPNMPFDPLKDFRAVSQTMAVPMGIAVHPSVKATTLAELLDLARAKPGTVSYGTPGIGTTHHVMGEMLALGAKVKLSHAPFQGGAPALAAVNGGHITMVYANTTEFVPAVKSGKLRAIVVTSAERADGLSDIPTMREAGFPELEASNWSGIVVPAAAPAPVVARLNAELVRALASADIQEKFRGHGMTAIPSTPDAFAAFLQSEAARYGKTVREAGIKPE